MCTECRRDYVFSEQPVNPTSCVAEETPEMVKTKINPSDLNTMY